MKNLILVILILICSFSVNAAPRNKNILIKVITPELAWADSQIETKILKSFSSQSNLRVQLVNDKSNTVPQFPENFYDTDLVLEWGKEIGGRYMMIVDVQSERLEKRKSFHLPLIFHKYQTYGVIECEMRLFDLERGKLLSVKSFKVEEEGSRIFQATMDDNINDPDLHITAPGKIHFFNKLEDKFVTELKKKSKVYFGLR